MNKLQRKYVANHWWKKLVKKSKINQCFVNHVFKKFNTTAKIENQPYIDENDEFVYGKIVVDKIPKKFDKWRIFFEYNDFYIKETFN